MGRKPLELHTPDPHRVQLSEELVRLGLSRDEAEPLAGELLRMAEKLPAAEYRALVEGVVLGQRLRRAGSGIHESGTSSLTPILEDFASELKKLDEGLRVLTAYLVRLRDETRGSRDQTLH
ncbi:MAG: hypothetical protein AAF430_22615 [Myxococcota bacterium]